MPCKDFFEWSTPESPYDKKLWLSMPKKERSMSTPAPEELVDGAGLVEDDRNETKPELQSSDELESSWLNLDCPLTSPPTYVDSISENGSSTTPCDIASTIHGFSDRTMMAGNCGELGAPQSLEIPSRESHRCCDAVSVSIEVADISITVQGKCKIVIGRNEAPLFNSTNTSVYDNEHRANDVTKGRLKTPARLRSVRSFLKLPRHGHSSDLDLSVTSFTK
ncbi:hypothetical protein ACEPAI_8245 [Sanghuangporus weigelae]